MGYRASQIARKRIEEAFGWAKATAGFRKSRHRGIDRVGRGMLITDKGRQVLHHAARIMAEFQHIRSVVADENAPIAGHVSVGMPQTAADVLSEPLVEAFRHAHPDATLRLVSAYSGHLLEWLYKGEIDASILYDPETAGLPPEKWSSLRYGFLPCGGLIDVEEAAQAGGDRRKAAAG